MTAVMAKVQHVYHAGRWLRMRMFVGMFLGMHACEYGVSGTEYNHVQN